MKLKTMENISQEYELSFEEQQQKTSDLVISYSIEVNKYQKQFNSLCVQFRKKHSQYKKYTNSDIVNLYQLSDKKKLMTSSNKYKKDLEIILKVYQKLREAADTAILYATILANNQHLAKI